MVPSNILLNFAILTPVSGWAFLAIGLMVLCLAMLYCLSLARSGVTLISDNDAKILHNRKSRREQRLYSFYQRKYKVKASISTMEIFISLVFVILALSTIQSQENIFNDYFAIFCFGDSGALPYICTFLIIGFVLVAAISIPSRVYTDSQKDKFLWRTSWFVQTVYTLASPLTFVDAYSKKQDDSDSSEISVAIDSSHTKTGEKDMLRNILQFGDTEVKEIMTPRHDIVSVEKNDSFSNIKRVIVESNFSRIPVYDQNPDNLYGIIYVKDLLKYVNRGDDFVWTSLVRNISYVSENKKISDLLKVFQQQKIHMAAVSDEYGGISGLITMQDILEEIVGEINDEFDDSSETMFKKIDDTFYIFDGKIMLNDFCKTMSLDDTFFDDVKGDAESLAGVLLEMRGEFPRLGEKIIHKNFTFSVESFNGKRIEKIGVRVYE